MKGGTPILAYEITVFLGSIPFITFLTWQARFFGLNKKSAFFIPIYLCGNIMLFPWALRYGEIKWWFLSIIVLFIGLVLWTKVHTNKAKDSGLASQKINVYAENVSNEEVINVAEANAVDLEFPIDVVVDEEIIEPIESDVVDPKSRDYMEEKVLILPIDELIDLGFKEKDLGNFGQAAFYFICALSQDPTPDLAISLIMDCYWLWNNLGKRDYAITELLPYVLKYLPLFNAELRRQFDTWMVKEDLK